MRLRVLSRNARRLRIGRDQAAAIEFSERSYLFTMSDIAGGPIMSRGQKRFLCERASRLVEPDGIEPTTSCLQSRRSPN